MYARRRELRLIFGVIIAAILIWAVLSGFVLVHNARLVTG